MSNADFRFLKSVVEATVRRWVAAKQLQAVEAEIARRKTVAPQPAKPLHEMDSDELRAFTAKLHDSALTNAPARRGPAATAVPSRPLHELADDQFDRHAADVWSGLYGDNGRLR